MRLSYYSSSDRRLGPWPRKVVWAKPCHLYFCRTHNTRLLLTRPHLRHSVYMAGEHGFEAVCRRLFSPSCSSLRTSWKETIRFARSDRPLGIGLAQGTIGGWVDFGGVLMKRLSGSLARATPLFHCHLKLWCCFKFAISICNGKVSFEAPLQPITVFLSVRYGVARAHGETP